MTKVSKAVLCILMIALIGVFFVGCESYGQSAVGELTSGAVVNNGSSVVMQDGYLYYINGKADSSKISKPQDNWFGNASVKGSIMKSKIGEDGSLSDTKVVVPKMFNTSYTSGGIYIFGSWIYYVSPSTKTDNKDVVQTSDLEYMRTKTDGTKTQSIGIVSGTSTQYVFTESGLIYYTNNTLTKIPYDDHNVGKSETIAESVTNVLFTAPSDAIFYTLADEDASYGNNRMYVYADGKATQIAGRSTYGSDDKPARKDQYTLKPVVYDAAEKVLYYSKTRVGKENGSDIGGVTTVGYSFADGFSTIAPASEKVYATSALASVKPMGMENGLMSVGSAEVVVYKPMTQQQIDSGLDNKTDSVTLSGAPTVLFTEKIGETEYLYYLVSNKLMRATDYLGGVWLEEKVYDETISSDWLLPARIGTYIYYFNSNESSYLYRLNYRDFEYGKDVELKTEIVSGYVDNDKTEDGKAPAFMTEEDLKTYIAAHKKAD